MGQDSALMRPGRLDRILYVGAPDLPARREIFRIKLATMALEPGVDLEALADIVCSLLLFPASERRLTMFRRKGARAQKSFPSVRTQRSRP